MAENASVDFEKMMAIPLIRTYADVAICALIRRIKNPGENIYSVGGKTIKSAGARLYKSQIFHVNNSQSNKRIRVKKC